MPQEGLRPGDVVAGKYRVRKVLSRGHDRGQLVEAAHTEFDQQVVIRMLAAHLTDPKELERFRRESRVLAKLTSEHAARIIDVGTERDGSFYLVRQHLEGESLGALIRRQRLAPHQAVDYVLQAAEAVAEAHAHGVVLRELSTDDLFLAKRLADDGLVKIIDFGTAKLLREDPGVSDGEVTTATMFGLSPYSSPELVRKDPGLDHRTDVWSLGVILYELLCGQPPFSGDMAGLMIQITKEDPAPIHRVRRDVPHQLGDIVLRALAKDTSDRFPSVFALARVLRPFSQSPRTGVLIDRIEQLDRARVQADHRSNADDDEIEISQVEIVAGRGADDDDDATRVAFDVARYDENTDPTKPRPSAHRPKSTRQEKTMPVGRSFVPVSPGPPPAPAPPSRPASTSGMGTRGDGPQFAGAAVGLSTRPPPAPPSAPKLREAAPSIPPAPIVPPRSLAPPSSPSAGSAPAAEPPPMSSPGPASAPYSYPQPTPTAPRASFARGAVVALIAAACVVFPAVLVLLFYEEEQPTPTAQKTTDSNSGPASAPTVGTDSGVDTAPTASPPENPDTPDTDTPESGDGGDTDDGANPPTAATAAPPPPPVANLPPPSSTSKPPPTKTSKPPSPPPPPPPPKESSGGKGTLVAIAVGGTCAFSVNGASKGTTTTLKLPLDPGTYAVTCKPATGATKSRSVLVKSGATAMAMFKL